MTRQESLGSEERVKRLEELLVKCKETITQKNDRIQELNDTVKQLETRADGLAGEVGFRCLWLSMDLVLRMPSAS